MKETASYYLLQLYSLEDACSVGLNSISLPSPREGSLMEIATFQKVFLGKKKRKHIVIVGDMGHLVGGKSH